MRDPEKTDWQPLGDVVPVELFTAEVRARAKRPGVEPEEVACGP